MTKKKVKAVEDILKDKVENDPLKEEPEVIEKEKEKTPEDIIMELEEKIKELQNALLREKADLENIDDPQTVKSILEKIKEEIFEFTGGHRILYEISQVINRLNSAKSLSDLFDAENPSSESIEKYLEEKIDFWINK